MNNTIQTLFNPSVGINELMPMPESGKLPQAKELASNSLQNTGLETLYDAANARSSMEAFLCPNVGDGHLVSPEVFHSELLSLLEKLKESDNPKIQALLQEEIVPLLQNGVLLSAYRGLMLGG